MKSKEVRAAGALAAIKGKGGLHRAAEIISIDVEARTVELSFSSEAEIPRWFGLEVLSHDPGAARLGRLEDGGALLDSHGWDKQRGVVEQAWIGDDRKGRALVRFGTTQAADDLFREVAIDKIKRHVSVGYFVHELRVTGERDGIDIVTVTDWEPYEISIVSVPADVSVGVGRSAEIPPEDFVAGISENEMASAIRAATAVKKGSKPMFEKNVRDAAGNLVRAKVGEDGQIVEVIEVLERASDDAKQHTQRGADMERSRVRAIVEMAEKVGGNIDNIDDLVRTATKDGHSAEMFQGALLNALNERAARPLSEQLAGTDIGLSERDVRQYSLMNVVRALSDPTDQRAQKAASFEFAASEAARAKQNKQSERFVIPTDVLRRSVYPDVRAMNTSTAGGAAGNTGGFSVATNLLAASFIDILRNRATIMKMGRVLGGLVGNIDIPKQVSGASGYWLGEDADATESNAELGHVLLSPKTVAAYSEITRKLAMQSSLDIEALVRADLAIALALTIDKAGYYGLGNTNQPLGIASTSGINAVNLAVAGKPTYAELVDMETQIATDNADVESMAYVGSAGFRGHAKTTLKFPAAGSATLWEPGGQINGYTTQITNQVGPLDVFMGNFADLIIGMWGGLELTVDPYSNSKKGRLRIVAFQDVDYAVRRPESFCLGRKTP